MKVRAVLDLSSFNPSIEYPKNKDKTKNKIKKKRNGQGYVNFDHQDIIAKAGMAWPGHH